MVLNGIYNLLTLTPSFRPAEYLVTGARVQLRCCRCSELEIILVHLKFQRRTSAIRPPGSGSLPSRALNWLTVLQHADSPYAST